MTSTVSTVINGPPAASTYQGHCLVHATNVVKNKEVNADGPLSRPRDERGQMIMIVRKATVSSPRRTWSSIFLNECEV